MKRIDEPATPGSPEPGGSVAAAWHGRREALAVIVGLGIWDLNDASGPQGVPHASVFLVIVSLIFAFAALRSNGAGFTFPPTVTAFIFACLITGIAMTPFRRDFASQYVISDVGTLLFFLLCLAVASRCLPALTGQRTVVWFVATYVVIACFAYVAATANLRPEYYYAGRWDPPYFMLFAGLALLSRMGDRLATRATSSILLVVMLFLALQSGNRTQFLLALLAIALVWGSNILALHVMALALVVFLCLLQTGVVSTNPFAAAIAESRFSLLDGGADLSLTGRFDEVRDISYHISHLNTTEQTLFGRGAGALWKPISRQRLILDAGGYAYYLHIGFLHMFYRYGVAGLLLFLYWIWAAFASVKFIVGGQHSIGVKFWLLGGLGFSLNFFLQNSLYDPPAVLAMAVTLVLAHNRRRDSAITGPSASRLRRAHGRPGGQDSAPWSDSARLSVPTGTSSSLVEERHR